MKFTVRMANMNIEIESLYDHLQEYCKDYCIPECEPDISIKMEMEDIEAERNGEEGIRFTNEYLETIALLRKIAEVFPMYNRVLCHGAAITYADEGAFLFTAPSGTGKTTHVRLWRRHFGDDVRVINGDKPFLEIRENTVQVYGSPWAGKEGWQKNRDAELKGICFLKRGNDSSIRRLEPLECLEWIMNQIYVPKKSGMVDKTLEHIEKILERVPVYELTCNISEKSVGYCFEALTGLKYEEHAIKIKGGKENEN